MLDTLLTKDGSTTSAEPKTGSTSSQICSRCLDGFHKCWPGDCLCTLCNAPLRAKPARPPRKPSVSGPVTRAGAPRKIALPLSEDMVDYVARELLAANGQPFRISAEEWDAVHARRSWTHNQIAVELGISFERVRSIKRMPRPEGSATPSFDRIASRAGCSYGQVRKIYKDLVELRDAETSRTLYPPYGGTFT